MPKPIRINLTIHQDAFPELFQEMTTISRGRGRSDRLKLLATVGLDGGFKKTPPSNDKTSSKGVFSSLAKFQTAAK